MRLSLYQEISRAIKSNKLSLTELLEQYQGKAPPLHLEGAYYRVQQIQTRKLIGIFNRLEWTPQEIWGLFRELLEVRITSTDGISDIDRAVSTIVVHMAKKRFGGVSPCYLARIVVKGYWEVERNRAKANETALKQSPSHNNDSMIPTTSTILLSSTPTNESVELTREEGKKSKKLPHFSQLFRNPSLITHVELADNVRHCHQVDPENAPAMDAIRNEIGRYYEAKLTEFLELRDIPHLSEEVIRRLGYSKTPDAILLEPIAIARPDGSLPIVIKWIESKGWFGDPASHQAYLQDQYWPYYNRFGPGLVIYWCGFVEEPTLLHQHQGIVVMDDFPENIIKIVSPMMPLVETAALSNSFNNENENDNNPSNNKNNTDDNGE